MTNREIAEKLKISPATLSLVINGKPGISNTTRARIIEQLQGMDLGHLIKKTASDTRETPFLCFVVYKKTGAVLDTHSFFLLLLESAETCAHSYNYELMISTIDERCPLENQIQQLSRKKVDGILLFATEMSDSDMEPFLNLPLPFIALDNDFTQLNCNTLSINNRMGTAQAIDYLVSMGHQHIGYLASNAGISSFSERAQGYRIAMAEHGLRFEAEDIVPVRFTEEDCFQDVGGYLKTHSQTVLPSAFVCDDDTVAVGAIRAFTAAGLQVPEDVSIIGFNNRPCCEPYNLTTISVHKHLLASQAVHELVRQIREPELYAQDVCVRKLRLGTKLVERGSVKKL